MSYFRLLSATLLSAAATFSLVTASGCGTSAVGVDECRDIEQARCRASASCLDAKGNPLIEDVPACERYYRDHCLHGLAVKPPAGASVGACLDVIEAAGRCAKSDPEAPLDCTETASTPRGNFSLACDLVAHPERAVECAFLLEVPEEDGSGGAGGQAGSESGGSAGQSGSTSAESGQGGVAPE
jgi:hypothetical protein